MEAIVIGAGVGGMASACRLARLGVQVTIFERRAVPGGRLSSLKEKGFRIDRGPTLLLMPNLFREFFTDMGRDLDDYMEIERLDPVYSMHFDDGSVLEPSAFKDKMVSNISKINETDASKYERFLSDYDKYYDIAMKEFILKNFDSPLQLINPAGIKALLSGGALKDMYSKTGEYFNDPRVRIAFCIQSIYLGERPEATPSVYGIVPYVEFTEGVWYPKGGLYSVAESLAKMCKEFKVSIKYGDAVKSIIIEDGTAKGVRLSSGKKAYADFVVSDVDLPSTYLQLISEGERPHMPANKIRKLASSCSTFMLYLGIKGSYPITHHNFILPLEFKGTLDDIFKSKEIPGNPGIYIANPSSHDPSLAPKGHSVIYILVPVPNLSGDIDWKKEKKAFREKVLDRLSALGMDDIRDRIVYEKLVTPEDWKEEFNLNLGSTFGLSPVLQQSAAFRPPNKDPKIKNLYFVGASTHPGSGLPIVFLSSKLLEMRIKADFGL